MSNEEFHNTNKKSITSLFNEALNSLKDTSNPNDLIPLLMQRPIEVSPSLCPSNPPQSQSNLVHTDIWEHLNQYQQFLQQIQEETITTTEIPYNQQLSKSITDSQMIPLPSTELPTAYPQPILKESKSNITIPKQKNKDIKNKEQNNPLSEKSIKSCKKNVERVEIGRAHV